MATIAFVTWGSLGDLHPFVAIGLELKRRGHHVVIATLGQWRENVERAGIEFRPIRPNLPQDQVQTRALTEHLLDARDGSRYLFETVLGPHLRDTYEDTRAAVADADVVLSHLIPLTTAIVMEQSTAHWVSCVLQPMGFLSAYDPPTPALSSWVRTVAALHPILGRVFRGFTRWMTERWMASVYDLRQSLGLPRGKNPFCEGQHSPACVLGLFSPLLAAPQPDFPPHTVLAGFPFYDAAAEAPLAADLLRFFAAGEPPIVFTLGTSAVWLPGDFYDLAIAAARRLGKRALLLAGDNAPALRERLGADAHDIAVVDYVSHSLVMPRAAAIVHQGGMGTTGQALRAGRPMLVVPYGQDQPDNARRVVGLGVARTIRRATLNGERLTRELSAVLSDPALARRATLVGEQVRAERGAERAADEIEGQLSSPRKQRVTTGSGPGQPLNSLAS